jgi:transcriptional regulator with XRE-family HTH domain
MSKSVLHPRAAEQSLLRRLTENVRVLRRWMAAHEVKGADICRGTGIRPQLLCHILKGRASITKVNAVRLAGFTGIPVENLVDQKNVLILRTNLRDPKQALQE